MLSIVYVSSATRLLEENELLDMLKTCQRNNARTNVTGLLLYKGGDFMQAIEGPEPFVRGLYKKIQRDTRHTGVYKLLERNIEEREFSNWTMAFQNVDKLPPEALSGFSSFLADAFTSKAFTENPSRAHKLLLMFRENMR